MNIWHDINPKQITTEEFIAVIEIPKNSKVKYELNKETGVLEMDQFYTRPHYPANYGFIQEPMPMTATRWMFSYSVPRISIP